MATQAVVISVVIGCYNYGRYLGAAIDSVLAQRGWNIEILVVDDGSTDDTPEVAARYGQRVRYIRTQHRGAAAARNLGWRAAQGGIICFLDADDLWLPGKLDRQMDVLEADSDCGLVYCNTRRIHADGRYIDLWSDHFPPVSGDAFLAQLELNRMQTSTVMVRRDAIQRVGGFDESLVAWEDVDLWVRLGRWYRFGYVPEPLACYRMHGLGLSTRALAMAQGQLHTTAKALKLLRPGEASPLWQRRVLANAYADVGIAHYLNADMRAARQWLLRAWGHDPTSLLRRRTAATFCKTWLGRDVVVALRKRLRQPPPSTR